MLADPRADHPNLVFSRRRDHHDELSLSHFRPETHPDPTLPLESGPPVEGRGILRGPHLQLYLLVAA